MGTAVGTKVFVQYGWRAAASVSMAWHGLQLLLLLARGPHVNRYTWFGYEGGLEARKSEGATREARLDENVRQDKDVDAIEKGSADQKADLSPPAKLKCVTVEDGERRIDEKNPLQHV